MRDQLHVQGVPDQRACRRTRRRAGWLATGPTPWTWSARTGGLPLLVAQFTSPIVLILVAATVLSMALGDLADGLIILVIVAAGGALGFWREHTAGQAVEALMAQVRVEAEVRRGGREVFVPVEQVVVGDLVVLGAGDVVPADCRVVASQGLLVDQAALTGESYPAEKRPGVAAAGTPPGGRSNSLLMGTHVVSGAGEAVVVATGRSTEPGAVSARLAARRVRTGFERGITAFGVLLVRAMVVLVAAIFVVDLLLRRPLVESLLFSLALAVGLTPQLLPAIVSLSLAAGARRMAAEKVVVKRLDAIEDFGAMTVLCTDKTGAITSGVVRLSRRPWRPAAGHQGRVRQGAGGVRLRRGRGQGLVAVPRGSWPRWPASRPATSSPTRRSSAASHPPTRRPRRRRPWPTRRPPTMNASVSPNRSLVGFHPQHRLLLPIVPPSENSEVTS